MENSSARSSDIEILGCKALKNDEVRKELKKFIRRQSTSESLSNNQVQQLQKLIESLTDRHKKVLGGNWYIIHMLAVYYIYNYIYI